MYLRDRVLGGGSDVLPFSGASGELLRNLVNAGNLIQHTFSLDDPQISIGTSPTATRLIC